jgi:ligand-binding SRPBCC domain-containing protein
MGIRCSSVVAAPLAEVFAWHERPGAIERLTPPFQPVRIVREAQNLADSDAVLRLPGGLRWVATHEACDPPNGFVDRLTSLPLRWRHEHHFEALGTTSTVVRDIVDTPVPQHLLQALFTFRDRQLAEDLVTQEAMRAIVVGTLSVGVTGASGLVGRSLCALLSTAGHRVVRFVRRSPNGPDERAWDPRNPDPAAFEGIDAVVHLAGASIAGRFTASHKQAIRESRCESRSKSAARHGRKRQHCGCVKLA